MGITVGWGACNATSDKTGHQEGFLECQTGNEADCKNGPPKHVVERPCGWYFSERGDCNSSGSRSRTAECINGPEWCENIPKPILSEDCEVPAPIVRTPFASKPGSSTNPIAVVLAVVIGVGVVGACGFFGMRMRGTNP